MAWQPSCLPAREPELPAEDPQFQSTEHVSSRDLDRNKYWGEADYNEEAKLVETILEAIKKRTKPGSKWLTLGKLL